METLDWAIEQRMAVNWERELEREIFNDYAKEWIRKWIVEGKMHRWMYHILSRWAIDYPTTIHALSAEELVALARPQWEMEMEVFKEEWAVSLAQMNEGLTTILLEAEIDLYLCIRDESFRALGSPTFTQAFKKDKEEQKLLEMESDLTHARLWVVMDRHRLTMAILDKEKFGKIMDEEGQKAEDMWNKDFQEMMDKLEAELDKLEETFQAKWDIWDERGDRESIIEASKAYRAVYQQMAKMEELNLYWKGDKGLTYPHTTEDIFRVCGLIES